MRKDAVQDPVCGMVFERADAIASIRWEGRQYYFCSESCRRMFDADPGACFESEELPTRTETVRIAVVGLPCAAGDRLPVERALSRVTGVLDAYVNPVDEAAYLTIEPGRFRVEDAVAAIEGFGARGIIPGSFVDSADHTS